MLILFDGHKSHVNLALQEWGRENNVIFFVLPPHTSHLLQPLDVGCFAPLKAVYYRECQIYLGQNPGTVINKYVVGELSSKAFIKAMTPNNLTSAFQKSGLYPFNKDSVPSFQLAPSTIYPIPEKEINMTNETNEDDMETNQDDVPEPDRNNVPEPDRNNNAPEDEAVTNEQSATSNKENRIPKPIKNTNKQDKTIKKKTNNKQCSNLESGSAYLKSLAITKVNVEKKESSQQTAICRWSYG